MGMCPTFCGLVFSGCGIHIVSLFVAMYMVAKSLTMQLFILLQRLINSSTQMTPREQGLLSSFYII
jgi:hypothetical protein